MSATSAWPARTRPRRAVRPGRVAGRTGFYLLLAIFVLVSLFPFYWIVITSLKSQAQLEGHLQHPARSHHVGQLHHDFTRADFVRPLLNSAIVSLSATLLTVIIASLAGYAVSRTRMRGRTLVLGFILVAGFFPIMAMVGPLVSPTGTSGC